MQGELKGKAGLIGVVTPLEFSYYVFNVDRPLGFGAGEENVDLHS
jgi:hypothetical protein